MAEAMELDLTLKESTNNPLENPIVPPIGTLEKKESETYPVSLPFKNIMIMTL